MLTDSEKKRLDKDGFLLLENLIPFDTTAQLRERALSLATAEQKTGSGHTYLAKRIARALGYSVSSVVPF